MTYIVTLQFTSGKSSTLPPIPEAVLNTLIEGLDVVQWVHLRDGDCVYVVNTENIEALSIKPTDNDN